MFTRNQLSTKRLVPCPSPQSLTESVCDLPSLFIDFLSVTVLLLNVFTAVIDLNKNDSPAHVKSGWRDVG